VEYSLAQLSSTPFTFYDCEIDAKRGLIIKNGKEVTIEPKVMTVLLYLIANAGQVVDQETLFAHAWPKSIFSPNSLRRCISTLRKAFSDDDKKLISTHPKIGYSINARPNFDIQEQRPLSNTVNINHSVAVLSTALLVTLLIFFVLKNESKNELNVLDMTPVTATDMLEDFVSVSPDGSHLAFTRFRSDDIKSSTLWLKDTSSGIEKRLPVSNAHIRNLNWTTNGKSILFVEVTTQGWQVKRAFLNQAFDLTKVETLIKDDKQSWISSVHLYDEHDLYFISNHESTTQLYHFNLTSKNLTNVAFDSETFVPYELTIANDMIAVTGQPKGKQTEVKLLKVQEHSLVTSYQLDVTERFSIDWFTDREILLLNNGRRLFSLDNTGVLTKVPFENSQFIRFANATKNNIYFISGSLDHDIQLLDPALSKADTIFDSTGMDYFPSISHDNKQIAFYSTRYGKPQLFIYDVSAQQSQLVFENPDEFLNVDKAVWSAANNKVAFSMGNNIFTIDMSTQTRQLQRHSPILGRIIGWYQNEDSLLIQQQDSGKTKLVKYLIDTGELETVAAASTGRIILSPVNKIFSINNNQLSLVTDNSTKVIASFSSNIRNAIPTQDGIYLNFENENNTWRFWSYHENRLLSEKAITSDKKIIAMSMDTSVKLGSTEQRQRDIVKLSIE
jgi:DNA-binding winged helix-turn-helix (wHTH) protein/Tol biopolymer transport system component